MESKRFFGFEAYLAFSMVHTTLAADGILRYKDSKKWRQKTQSIGVVLQQFYCFNPRHHRFTLLFFLGQLNLTQDHVKAIIDLFLAIKSVDTKIRESILLSDLLTLVATFGSSATSVKSFLGSLLYLVFWCTIQSHLKRNHIIPSPHYALCGGSGSCGASSRVAFTGLSVLSLMASRRARPDGRNGCNRGICTAQAKGGAKGEWLPGRLGAFGPCGWGNFFSKRLCLEGTDQPARDGFLEQGVWKKTSKRLDILDCMVLKG